MLDEGGVVALQTYAGLDEQHAYGPFVSTVVRHAGDGAGSLIGTYWSQGDLAVLRSLLEGAGLAPIQGHSRLGEVRFPSMDAFVRTEIQGTPLAARVDERTYGTIAAEVRTVLAAYEHPDGAVTLPIRACFIAGRKKGAAG